MKSHELKEKLVKDINESELPIDAVYFVVKEVLSAISMLYNEELTKQENKEKEKK